MPGINRIEQSGTIGLIKLVRRVPPCLEERICQESVAHDASSQWASQDPLAPRSIQIPVIGHIMVVTDRVRSDVGQRPSHLWQGRPERAQALYMIFIRDISFLL